MSTVSEPQFSARDEFAKKVLKTVTLDGQRTSFRLEKAFWDAARILARLRGLSSKSYLDRLFRASAKLQGSNRSGYIRAFIAADLTQHVHAGRMEDNELKAIVRTAPTPVFVLSPRGEILDYNDEMAQFIRTTVQRGHGQDEQRLELRFARPISVIEQELIASAGAPALVNFNLLFGEATSTGRARLTLIGNKDAEIRRLIGFVQT